MSSGEKFLKRKTAKSLEISRANLTDVLASWLHATRMIDDAQNITDIKFHPHTVNEDLLTLEVITTGGKPT
jgi:hypothetical protein